MKLETKRLKIVPLDEKYAEDLLEIWSDRETIRYTNALLLKDVEDARAKIKGWLRMGEESNHTSHFVILKGEEVVGVIGIPNVLGEEGKCGFYYQLIKHFWNKGYGKEAAKVMLEYGIQDAGVKVLIADAVRENEASIKILRGLGFKQIGISKNDFEEHGQLHDVIHFEYIVKA